MFADKFHKKSYATANCCTSLPCIRFKSVGDSVTFARLNLFHPWPAVWRYMADNTSLQLHMLEINEFICSEASSVIITNHLLIHLLQEYVLELIILF